MDIKMGPQGCMNKKWASLQERAKKQDSDVNGSREGTFPRRPQQAGIDGKSPPHLEPPSAPGTKPQGWARLATSNMIRAPELRELGSPGPLTAQSVCCSQLSGDTRPGALSRGSFGPHSGVMSFQICSCLHLPPGSPKWSGIILDRIVLSMQNANVPPRRRSPGLKAEVAGNAGMLQGVAFPVTL